MELSETIPKVEAWLHFALSWTVAHVLTVQTLGQVVALAVTLAIARALARPVRAWARAMPLPGGIAARTREIAMPLVTSGFWLLMQMVLLWLADALQLQHYVLRVSISLLTAWLVIRLLSAPLRNPIMSRLVAIVAWSVAALNILGILHQTLRLLDEASVPLGPGSSLSLRDVLVGALSLVVFVWIALIASQFAEQRISRLEGVNPSARVLLSKIASFALITIAIVVGLGAAGLDLTVFAVFGGAVGLGLGFGLQKVISNLFSGFILLMDRSIKPGDVVEVQGTYGWINKLATRYTSVITRDGTEYLIPNEDMITQPVVNWSHSNRLVRQHVKVGISYDSDVNLARSLAIEAAKETDRVLETPSPMCMLVNFGDSSVDLELRFWIEDPQNGVTNVCSAVRLKIWEKFHAGGVRFPFPQRDIHLVDAPGLRGLFPGEGT
ncbi:MAG: mechanosensitive ion channel [Alphaproteobacteria bacterium]|nr:mechanosensitive ion channel [Alphaproteobacteria bacterium]